MRRRFLLSASQQIRRLDRSRTRNDWPVRWAALTDGALVPLVARFEVALPEGLNRGQAGQTDNATGRVESDGDAELYTEAVGEFTQDAANPSPMGLEPF